MEDKTLKIIDKTGPDSLQKFIDKLDYNHLAELREFISNVHTVYKFQMRRKPTNVFVAGTKFYLQYSRNFGSNAMVACAIRNCSDIEDEATGSTEIIFEFNHNEGGNIVVSGSGDFRGCNKEEFDEFLSIIKPMIRDAIRYRSNK